jgi:hypothetical protein
MATGPGSTMKDLVTRMASLEQVAADLQQDMRSFGLELKAFAARLEHFGDKMVAAVGALGESIRTLAAQSEETLERLAKVESRLDRLEAHQA